MATLTDPASELADIAKTLTNGASEPGDRFLARSFGAEPWSTEFVKIIACIYERADLVERIVAQSALDPDVVEQCRNDLKTFRSAFAAESLHEAWNTAPRGGLPKVQAGGRLAYLQSTVRAYVSYPKLSDAEVAELIELIDSYLRALSDNEDELPLVRQAIVDGLTAFRFQLKWVRWMGAAYSLSAFRDVVWTYQQSAEQYTTGGTPDPASMLSGLLDVITSFADKAKAAKGYADTAQWMWKGYSLASPFAVPLLAAPHLPRLTG